MHLDRILTFAFLEDTCKQFFDFLRSNNCNMQPVQPNSSCNGSGQPIIERNPYDLGRVACSTHITYNEESHYKPVSTSKARENTNIRITCDEVFLQIF